MINCLMNCRGNHCFRNWGQGEPFLGRGWGEEVDRATICGRTFVFCMKSPGGLGAGQLKSNPALLTKPSALLQPASEQRGETFL